MTDDLIIPFNLPALSRSMMNENMNDIRYPYPATYFVFRWYFGTLQRHMGDGKFWYAAIQCNIMLHYNAAYGFIQVFNTLLKF